MASFLQQLGAAMDHMMAWLCYPAVQFQQALRHKFVLENGNIVFYQCGLYSHEQVAIADIACWEVEAILWHDRVTIEMNDGKVIVWFDERDDLISLLKEWVPNGKFVDDAY
jgi:hypothetical protein